MTPEHVLSNAGLYRGAAARLPLGVPPLLLEPKWCSQGALRAQEDLACPHGLARGKLHQLPEITFLEYFCGMSNGGKKHRIEEITHSSLPITLRKQDIILLFHALGPSVVGSSLRVQVQESRMETELEDV